MSTQTNIKNTDKALIEGPSLIIPSPKEAPVESLTVFRSLPPVENEMQTDNQEF